MCFQNYRLQERRLDECLKNPLSGDLSTSNRLKGPKHYWNLETASLPYLLIAANII